jgi:Papain-like cysteine protease AvrRpt2
MSVRATALLSIAWPPAAMAAAAVPARRLDVIPVGQEMKNWCWAACIDMARGQQKLPDLSQLAIVKNGISCMTSCDSAPPPDKVAQAFKNNHLARASLDGPVKRQKLIDQLGQGTAGNCVAIGWELTDPRLPRKHMVLVIGYSELAGDKMLVIDPGGPDRKQESEKSMSELAEPRSDGSAAGSRRWKWTWLDLRR